MSVYTEFVGCSVRTEARISEVSFVDGSWEATGTLFADWDDLDASLGTGLLRAEAAVLETASSDDRRSWTLVTIDNQQGSLVATRDPLGARDSRGCERLTLKASIGGKHGEARSSALIDGVARRLGQLAGVDWAPR